MSDSFQVVKQYSNEEMHWAVICHLAVLSCFVVPFGNLLGPLVVWRLKRNSMPLVDRQGKESLNFQITMTFATVIVISSFVSLDLMAFLAMILSGSVKPWLLIGISLLAIIFLVSLVLAVIASIKVFNGNVDYKYPFTIRVLD